MHGHTKSFSKHRVGKAGCGMVGGGRKGKRGGREGGVFNGMEFQMPW